MSQLTIAQAIVLDKDWDYTMAWFSRIAANNTKVCRVVKLLPLTTVGDLIHYCTRPSASCNSASGRPRHLRVSVLSLLQTGMK